MKKAIAMLLTGILLVAALTGCARSDIGIKLNRDGTGSVAASVGIEKSAYEQLVAMNGAELFESKETSEVRYGDKTYVTYTEAKEYGSYEEIQKALLELTYGSEQFESLKSSVGSEVETEADSSAYTLYQPEAEKKDNHLFSLVNLDASNGIFYSACSFRATVNPQKSDASNLGGAVKLTVTVNMPEEITQVKGGTSGGKTVVFDFTDLKEPAEIAAVSEANHYGVILGICGGLLILAAVFVFVIKRKK